MSRRTNPPAAFWSLDGLALGARLMLPLMPGMVAFGIAVGSAGAARGLTFFENLLMNTIVYAGLAQVVALEVWPAAMTWGAVAGLAIVVATVNARLLLLGAGLRPWLGTLPAWQVYPTLHLLTDPGWIVGMRYRAEGGGDAAVFLGGGLLIFVVWLASTGAGHLAAEIVPDPRAAALDLVVPVYFAVMLVPLWRGPVHGVPWLIAGLVALLVHHFVDGWWYVIAGALAGTVAGGFVDERD